MKKFAAFALILSLGMFTAVGCGPKPAEKPKAKPAVTAPAKVDDKAPETKAPETKAPEAKAPETKVPEEKAPETK